MGSPSGKSAVLTWQPKSGATGYRVDRADMGGKFSKLSLLKDPNITTYTDTTGQSGVEYRYRVRAYKQADKKLFGKSSDIADIIIGKNSSGKTTSSQTNSGNSTQTTSSTQSSSSSSSTQSESAQASSEKVVLSSVKWSDDVIKITWKPVEDAIGYEISRNEDGEGFEALEEVDEDVHSYEDEEVYEDFEYTYRVRAFFEDEDGGEYWGPYSKTMKPGSSTAESSSDLPDPTHKIVGDSETSVEQMVAFYEAKGKAYPKKVYKSLGAPTLTKFCRIVFEEAEEEGIKAEVVFAQICKETNFLQFGGTVQAKQCNFAGLGATDGGGKPETFSDVREGVRAQVQHLKAYACTDDLQNLSVDPRFNKVERGTAEYVEWLGIRENPNGKGWATAKHYGYSLAYDYEDVLLNTD